MSNATEVVSRKPAESRPARQTIAETRARKFFISYRRSENESSGLARFLAARLQAAGHEIFIDVGMHVGTDWVEEIARRIEWCDFLIVLLSEGARTSEMVQGEVRQAHHRRKRDGQPGILPIRVCYEGTLDYELDSYLGRLQYVVWTTESDSEPVLNAIIARADESMTLVQPTKDRTAPSAPPDTHRPQPRVDPRYVTAPGGSVSPLDPFYIERSADGEVLEEARKDVATTITIKGPRQMGKSSLLIRYMAEVRTRGRDVSFLDFREFADSELADYPRLLGALTDHFAQTLGGDPPSSPPMKQRDLTKYFEQQILARRSGQIVLAFDEAHRLFGRPYQHDFFTLLRLWHDKRAELTGWERVSLVLAISTEPYLMIDAEHRSPFNVSVPIKAEAFSKEACRQCNELYGNKLKDAEIDDLHELVKGQPYLTRLAFHRLSRTDGISFKQLCEESGKGNGPFGDHLRALLLILSRQPELLTALRLLITKGTQPTDDVLARLEGAGLVCRTGDGAKPANLVYARFFKNVLK